jgi:hypothetical protein
MIERATLGQLRQMHSGQLAVLAERTKIRDDAHAQVGLWVQKAADAINIVKTIEVEIELVLTRIAELEERK